MKGKSNFQQLIDMCNQVGWDKGIAALESIVTANENAQAYLFGGDYNEQKQAKKLSMQIIKQNLSIAQLKKYRKENNIEPLPTK